MRPTACRLVRVVPRNLLNVPEHKIHQRPRPQIEETKQPSLIDVLVKRRDAAKEDWPQNLRLERQLTKEAFRDVRDELRPTLKKMTKER
jgi:hypothetical protein